MRGETDAQAHEALRKVAAKRGDLQAAIVELEAAVLKDPTSQGSQFLLLGIAHLKAGNVDAARTALLRAIDLGPEEIRAHALDELRRLNRGDSDDR